VQQQEQWRQAKPSKQASARVVALSFAGHRPETILLKDNNNEILFETPSF
jgi:hypothetical protein